MRSCRMRRVVMGAHHRCVDFDHGIIALRPFVFKFLGVFLRSVSAHPLRFALWWLLSFAPSPAVIVILCLLIVKIALFRPDSFCRANTMAFIVLLRFFRLFSSPADSAQRKSCPAGYFVRCFLRGNGYLVVRVFFRIARGEQGARLRRCGEQGRGLLSLILPVCPRFPVSFSAFCPDYLYIL